MTTVLRLPRAKGPDTGCRSQPEPRSLRIFAGFWVLGLLNNAAYVIMIAGANEIASSAVGLVYLCAIGPTIVVKLTAPYWFHLVSYTARFWTAATLMSLSFFIVGFGLSTGQQLLGVGLVAVQGGLGEASALAMCSLYPNQLSLTAWSSGTGFAGIAGYAWVAILHNWLGLSYTRTLVLANIMPVSWLAVYHLVLRRMHTGPLVRTATSYHPLPVTSDSTDRTAEDESSFGHQCSSWGTDGTAAGCTLELRSMDSTDESASDQLAAGQQQQQQQQQGCIRRQSYSAGQEQYSAQQDSSACSNQSEDEGSGALHMTFYQRFRATCSLWPYMVPLFVVYFAEYAMQSGTWTVIGFPVTSAEARHLFYLYSNWTYQAGVFISRSSGMLYQANRFVLWLMPALQCMLLVFFSVDAITHVWYGWSLLLLCLLAGLFGGAVYVNTFTLLSKEVQPSLKEFSLSAACIADSLGIACADATAILIQGCLSRWQNIPGAAYACEPFS